MVMCAMCHHEVRGTCSQEEGSLQVVFSPLKWQPWKIPTIWLCSKNFEWGRRRLSLSSNSQCAPWRLMKIYFPYFGWLRPLSYSACADPRMQPVKVSLVDCFFMWMAVTPLKFLDRACQRGTCRFLFLSKRAGHPSLLKTKWQSPFYSLTISIMLKITLTQNQRLIHHQPTTSHFFQWCGSTSFLWMVWLHLLYSLNGATAPLFPFSMVRLHLLFEFSMVQLHLSLLS